MKNSSKYRLPPIKRTRDSFIDDFNSQQNPRIDLGKARHTQTRLYHLFRGHSGDS